MEFPHLRLATTVFFLLTLGLFCGCERENKVLRRKAETPSVIEHAPGLFADLPRHDLLDLPAARLQRLSFSEPRLFDSCRAHFEDSRGPLETWPFDAQESALAIFGCDPEGFIETAAGHRVVAYPVSMEGHERAHHLRILYFDADHTLRFHALMDRSAEAQNYTANYRGSFLTFVSPEILCAGTLWQGGTQLLCLNTDAGEPLYDGRLDFWAALPLFGFDGSLFSADTRGITRRYPFTGSEMRHRAFADRGGRSAFYGTDGNQIFFSSVDQALLTGWDLRELRPRWRLPLPDQPRVTYSYADDQSKLLFLKIGSELFGIDTDTGLPRMAYRVNESYPPIVFGDEEFYLLLQRTDAPPLLYALDAKTGDVNWVALAPMGTLQLHFDQGDLLTRSVRAVRRARHPHSGEHNEN